MTLERRTPLRRTPMTRGQSGLARGGALPARRAEPRRAGDRLEHGQPWAQVLEVLHARSRGACEGCGVRGVPLEGHHRRTRRFGPDCTCNALHLCADCHHVHAHGQPKIARSKGWALSRHGSDDPGLTPAMVHGQGTVFLDCAGGYT